MKLYPAIDLHESNCVRLVQGDYDKVTTYNNNPVMVAKEFKEKGASFLHLVDLDGAKKGSGVNDQAVVSILKEVEINVELGGGIRTLEDIDNKLKLGINRVILGSIAVKNIELVKEAISKYGSDRIVVGVDAKKGKVAISGWLEVTEIDSLDFCLELEKIGVKTVIYTDISKDGMMMGPNLVETKKIIDNTKLNVVASGGISSIKDLEALEGINAYGAIIGKALYINAIDLEEAVKRFE